MKITQESIQIFKEESQEHLKLLEDSLLELENNPADRDQIRTAFRALHTIKGSGALLGFDEISSFVHEVETVFEQVRDGEIPISNQLIDLALSAADYVKSMFNACETGEELDKTVSDRIIGGLKTYLSGIGKDSGKTAGEVSESADSAEVGKKTYKINFRPDAGILALGINPMSLLEELYALGDCQVKVCNGDIPMLEDYQPFDFYLEWEIILNTEADLNEINDVFIFIDDNCTLNITPLNSEPPSREMPVEKPHYPDDEDFQKKVLSILAEQGYLTMELFQKAVAEHRDIGEILLETGVITPEQIETTMRKQRGMGEQKGRKDQIVRVPSEKLDRLADLVGEIIINQAYINQIVTNLSDSSLTSAVEKMGQLTDDLRNNTLDMRMLPIGTMFANFRRMIRDLSRELDKEVDLSTEGEDTELDKTIIEQLSEPLLHLIRNSIDHGFEKPEERLKLGKPRNGRLKLLARSASANVIIEITDDGKGIDPAKVLKKAIEKGIVSESAKLSEKEIYSLIFTPNFSTAQEVTSVSGRGVGMDIVKRTIDNLRGAIEITSRLGHGTTISLSLPLTLAIIESLLIRVGDNHYVIPLFAVKESIEYSMEEFESFRDRKFTNLRGEVLPFINLRQVFECENSSDEVFIVITNMEDSRVGLVVDEIIGVQQTIVKSLGRIYQNCKEFSGASILGDGSIAIVLDVNHIVRDHLSEDVI